ncbi:MAG: glycosyltransferase [Anaerolineales bacterium]
MPVAIAGMHRSGTSMIARLLNLCGLYLGEENDLMPGALDNPEGFWENVHFVRMNERILSSLKSSWDAPPVEELGSKLPGLLNLYRKDAVEIIKDMNPHAPWGWKDPRNSLIFPFWQRLVPNLKVVVCLRNPYEVAQSLSKRGSSSDVFAMRLWHEYYRQLLNAVPPQDRIVTHYDAFFYDAQAELHRLVSFLNLPADHQTIEVACNSVNLSRKHNKVSLADLSNLDDYPEVKEMYSGLCVQAGPVFQLAVQNQADKTPFESAEKEKAGEAKSAPEQWVNDMRVRLMRNAHTIQSQEKLIKKQEKAIEQLSQQLDLRVAEVNNILQSRSWRLIADLRKIRDVVIPHGSLRERTAQTTLAAIRKILVWIKTNKITVGIKKILAVIKTNREINRLAKQNALLYKNPVLESPTVSIIIPVYNQIEYTLNCLVAIAASQDQAAYEVIVMDDASTDKTQKLLEKIRGIRYIRSANNRGFLVSCNEAAKRANGKYLVFLNNDTRVRALWLDNLLATFSLVPRAGLAGSKLIYPNEKLQEAGGIIWADGTGKNYGRNDDPQNCIYNYVRDADYISGASIMLPKTLWESLGGFDLQYQPAYYEDVDLAFKVRRAGYKVIYQPFSQITHFEGGSNGVDLTSGIKQYQVVNHKKFYATWQSTLASYGLPGETPDYVQRDRLSRAQVLYIDDLTPQPDRNAGAILSECYMTTLRDNGYAVALLTHFDARYADHYTQSLQKKGIECIYSPYLASSEDYIEQNGARFDYVIISRASVAAGLIDCVKEFAPQAKVVFNTIDLHFMRLERAAALSKKDDDLESARKIREIELDIIQKSDCTLVVSNVEAKLLSDLLPNAKVRVVPFPADIFEPENGYDERNDVVFLGGFMHTPNIDAVLYFANEIWPLVSQKLPGTRFVIAGPDAPQEILDLASDTIVVKGFVEDLGSLFTTAKLSVAPIRYGAGIKGKVLASLGYGVPCIATSVATEGIGLTNGENILVADTPAAFAEAIVRAFTTPESWNLLSRNGLDFIRQNYSRPVISSKLLGVFKEL